MKISEAFIFTVFILFEISGKFRLIFFFITQMCINKNWRLISNFNVSEPRPLRLQYIQCVMILFKQGTRFYAALLFSAHMLYGRKIIRSKSFF